MNASGSAGSYLPGNGAGNLTAGKRKSASRRMELNLCLFDQVGGAHKARPAGEQKASPSPGGDSGDGGGFQSRMNTKLLSVYPTE